MGLASAVVYIKSILNGMAWPDGMQALTNSPPPLAAFITPPSVDVEASVPTAYIWMARGNESRDHARYGAGTVPRALYQGGPSGTKAIDHMVPIYLVWNAATPTNDPYVDTLFPGMVDAVMATLRTSTNATAVVDPWSGAISDLVDVGENMNYVTDIRALEPMRANRWDALLECSVCEVISS